uniref:RING-type domain-containing protein n=1 Tax=Kalanchoe fedtschenkoi TaxID=63787 RepID=A0A7N0ZX28_KALFE
MDGGGAASGRRRSFKKRLGLDIITCCCAAWGLAPSTISVPESENDEEIILPPENDTQQLIPPPCTADGAVACSPPPRRAMNLAAALAVERNSRAVEAAGQGVKYVAGESPYTRRRVSLMRLFAEEVAAGEASGVVCCVCMVRIKGAAFIPCGHTYCRECSRELSVGHGTCPLCNRRIVEILDIF